MINALIDTGLTTQGECRVLGVLHQGRYHYRRRAMSLKMMRREWLTALIRQVHQGLDGTYGSRWVRAEHLQGCGCQRTAGTEPHV